MDSKAERMACALETLLDFVEQYPHPQEVDGWGDVLDEANMALDCYLEG